MDDATEWLANPASYHNVGATMEPGEPTTCGDATVHRSVWLRLEVLSPGGPDSFMVSFDAPFRATLGAYTRGGDGALTQVSCGATWEEEDFHQPLLFLPCTAGTVYWIQVGGRSANDVGTFRLHESQYWKFNMELSAPCPFKPSLPSEPRMYAPAPGNGEIGLFWVEPAWEGGRGVRVTSYNVYRADTCAGPFTLLGTSTYRGYDDRGLAPGASYCYRVTAVNEVGEGPSEPGRRATTWTAPRPPRNLAVAPADDGELRLSWFPSLDSAGPAPMTGHRVYRADTAEGPYALVGTAASGATGFLDEGLPRGATYHYRVSAVNVVGEGEPGAGASATTWALPGAPRDVQARALLAPPGFHVSWSPPAEDAPFTHYRVYRASSPGGPATFVAEVPRSASGVTDPGRSVLVDVYYEVRASNPAGEGPASARACAVYPLESPLARCR